MEHPGFYSVIPATVRYDANLTPFAIILYSEISALTNKRGYCSASNDYFAKLYNREPETISRTISSLAKAGHILPVIDKQDGNKRRIYLPGSIQLDDSDLLTKKAIDLLIKKLRPIDKKVNTPIFKKVKYNNTSINTTFNNKDSAVESSTAPPEKKLSKKKEADPAFQTVLDAFHEAHTVFHKKMADQHGGNFLPFQWTPKELKSLKEFLPIFRRAIAPKAGCQPEEIDAARLALNMTALCQRVESMDEWTKKNCYSPSGMLCHWAKISNSQAHGESRKAGRNDKPTVSNNADEARKFSDFLNGRGDTRTNMQKLLDEIDAITIAASGS